MIILSAKDLSSSILPLRATTAQCLWLIVVGEKLDNQW